MTQTKNPDCKYFEFCIRDYIGFECTLIGEEKHCCIYKWYNDTKVKTGLQRFQARRNHALDEGFNWEGVGIGGMIDTEMVRLSQRRLK